MLPQGVPGFQYEAEASSTGVTSPAGLPLYLDLIHSSWLAGAIGRHVRVAGAGQRVHRRAGHDRAEPAVTQRAAFADLMVAAQARACGAIAIGAVGLAGALP